MTPAKLKATRKALGLSLRGFAYFVGRERTAPRTVRRWESGTQDIPALLVALLDLLAVLPATIVNRFVSERMRGYDAEAAKRAVSQGSNSRALKRLAESAE